MFDKLKDKSTVDKLDTRAREMMQDDALVPLRYKKASFKNYNATTDKQQKLVEYLLNFNFDHDILLLGRTGTGKTHLACSTMNQFISKDFIHEGTLDYLNRGLCRQVASKVKYVKFYDLVDLRINDFKTFKELCNSYFLIIDEVGVMSTDFKDSLLFEVLSSRYDNLRSTMLISNLDAATFKNLTSDAVYSRLKENSAVFSCDWDDYRLKTKAA